MRLASPECMQAITREALKAKLERGKHDWLSAAGRP